MKCKLCGFQARKQGHEKGPHHGDNKEFVKGTAALKRAQRHKQRKTNIGDPNHDTCRGTWPSEYAAFHRREF